MIRSSALLLTAVVFSAPPAFASEAPEDAAALLAKLGSTRGLEAKFREEKTIAGLKKPIVAEGTLYYRAPDRLARVVKTPVKQRVVLTPTELVMQSRGKVQRLPLESGSELEALTGSMLSLFRGDLEALETHYSLKYARDGASWTLELLPKSERLRHLIGGLRFEGEGERVERFAVDEANGNRAVTEIEPISLDRTFSKAEIRELFEVP